MKLQSIFNRGSKWLSRTPERALDAAYRAAVKIKAIEDDYFQGQKVSSETAEYSSNVLKVFVNDVNNYLRKIDVRLLEFKASRAFLIFSEDKYSVEVSVIDYQEQVKPYRKKSIVERLDYIDLVTAKYKNKKEFSQPETVINNAVSQSKINRLTAQNVNNNQKLLVQSKPANVNSINTPTTETISDKTGVLPRSFMRTINRIRQEIDPQTESTEEEVIKKFRRSRNKTFISVYFLLIIIIVPLFTHQITKTFLISPIVEKYFSNHQQIVFINEDLEDEALMELHRYEENLHFKSLIGLAPPITSEEVEEKVHLKAEEIKIQYRYQGVNSVSNVFADFCSLFAFAAIIFFCKREIAIIKSFLDEIVYGLSDSAKAFLIILLTDMFVGYHSPHGWEVILEGIARHLGLPENHDFNFLFIATFPVILDTVLKYWIFRYLNRISPSSVATYKNMNE